MRYSRGTLLSLAFLLCNILHAQQWSSDDLAIKKLPDTILGRRTLFIRGPFYANRVLRQLFPGKWYDLSHKGYKNQLISWACPRCKPRIYPDANMEDTCRFPDGG